MTVARLAVSVFLLFAFCASNAAMAQTKSMKSSPKAGTTTPQAPMTMPEIKSATTDTAMAYLKAVCVTSLPDFRNVKKAAVKAGLNVGSPNVLLSQAPQDPEFFASSPSYDLYAAVWTANNGTRICRIGWESRESSGGYVKRLGKYIDIPKLKKTGEWPLFPGTNAVFTATTSAMRMRDTVPLFIQLEAK